MNGTRERQRGEERRDRRDLRPGRAAERAEHPEGDVAQLAVVGEEDEQADAGIGQRRDREPAEQQRGDRGAALARRDAVEHRGGRERADEGGERQRPRTAARRRAAPAACRRARWWRRRRARRRSTRRPAPGSASGLRNSPCMTAPAAASSAPIMRGQRDARQPDRPQHQLVALDRGRIAGAEAEARPGADAAECRPRRWSRRRSP